MNGVLKTVLDYYHDSGVDVLTGDYAQTMVEADKPAPAPVSSSIAPQQQTAKATRVQDSAASQRTPSFQAEATPQATPHALAEATRLANEANTLEELAKTIEDFDGLAVKTHASQMVFADGNPKAEIMVIGEAPGGDEDRMGKPFVGKAGQLLDRMFEAIGLKRDAEDIKNAIYISNILNWRPPGNRTPTPQEIEISLPFIEKHIDLIAPKIIVLMGSVPGKALLNKNEGITKIRGKWHTYQSVTEGLKTKNKDIQAIASFHPAYLLRQPLKKKESWHDLRAIRELYDGKNS
ncbi:MAG TPA: uracil-DNA glycosylase [Rhodospirillaceae bacterium]|nr:uracil-DNA glycosylase [Rhodospirillaceae bacterium]